MKRRMLVVALSAVLALAVATPMALGQAEQESTASAQTGELAAAWWQWAGSKPVAENPLIGGDPDYSKAQCNGQPVTETPGKAKWWFLGGTLDGSTVERTCTMPARRRLFFPVVNVVYTLSDPGDTEEVARQAVNEFMDSVLTDPDLSMSVTVDGKEVLRRADSPLFTITAPNDNIFELEPGSYDAVADGLWATVPPLAKGKHTIHFALSAPNEDFRQDNTYHLTVKRAKPAS